MTVGGGDDCECITEVGFVQLWNKLMMIKFADNSLKDDCLSDDRFADLVTSNLIKNQKALKDSKEAKDKTK